MGPIRRMVKKRGYSPIGACEIVMPINIFYIQDQRTSHYKIKKGLQRADEYAQSLMEGKAMWGRVPLISDFIHLISMVSWKLAAWNLHQRYLKFKSQDEKCNQCVYARNYVPVTI